MDRDSKLDSKMDRDDKVLNREDRGEYREAGEYEVDQRLKV